MGVGVGVSEGVGEGVSVGVGVGVGVGVRVGVGVGVGVGGKCRYNGGMTIRSDPVLSPASYLQHRVAHRPHPSEVLHGIPAFEPKGPE